MNVTFWVSDARRHNSKRVVLRLRVKATETVAIAATDSTASEPSTAGAFTVTRTGGGTASPLTVSYTVSGSATSGSDYAALSGSVTIPAGQSSATISIGPIDDTDMEGAETVILTLVDAAGYSVGTPSTDTVTIADDD